MEEEVSKHFRLTTTSEAKKAALAISRPTSKKLLLTLYKKSNNNLNQAKAARAPLCMPLVVATKSNWASTRTLHAAIVSEVLLYKRTERYNVAAITA